MLLLHRLAYLFALIPFIASAASPRFTNPFSFDNANKFLEHIQNEFDVDTSKPFEADWSSHDMGLRPEQIQKASANFLTFPVGWLAGSTSLKLLEIQQYSENKIIARIAPNIRILDVLLTDDWYPGSYSLIYRGNSDLRGGLNADNWDIMFDFGGVPGSGEGLSNNGLSYYESNGEGRKSRVLWKLSIAGVDGFPWLDGIHNHPTLRGGDVTHITDTFFNPGAGVKTHPTLSGQFVSTSISSTGPLGKFATLLSLAANAGLIKYPPTAPEGKETFKVNELTFINDPTRFIGGFKGGFQLGDAMYVGDAFGFDGELSVKFVPENQRRSGNDRDKTIELNSLAFGLSGLQLPVPGTAATVYWQDIHAGIYDLVAKPWYLKGETLFSHGKEKIKTGLGFEDYLFSAEGSAMFKSDGFWEILMAAKAFGVSMSEANITRDPRQAKFMIGFNDLPQPPLFLTDAVIGTSHGNFTATGTTRIGIPRAVPIIGGATLAGMDYGATQTSGIWDIFSQFNYQITPEIGPICSPVSVSFPEKKKRVWWDSCCTRAPWWLGGGCIGCPRFDFTDFIRIEWKTVCTDPVPAVKGSFRVGIKAGDWYARPAAYYSESDDFFSEMYLSHYPSWESPFYYSHLNELGQLVYYNYNWDRLGKVYSNQELVFPVNGFMPLSSAQHEEFRMKTRQQLQGKLQYDFDLVENDFSVIILRINYEGELTDPSDILLTLPDSSSFRGVTDNRPFGYDVEGLTISCTHVTDNKELFFTILEPSGGSYSLDVGNFSDLGRHTVEMYKQNEIPNFSFGEAEMAANRDATISKSQIDFTIDAIGDDDTPTSEITVDFYLDSNKKGFDGVKIGSRTLEELQSVENVRFETNELGINSGFYYSYIFINDHRNIPLKHYLNGQLFVQDDDAPEPVEKIKVLPTQTGFEISFEPAVDDTGQFNYEVVIMNEGDEDKSGKTTTVYDNSNHASIKGLIPGKPYIISVVTVDNESKLRSYPKVLRRVVPGMQEQRPVYVTSSAPASITVGYNYNYQITTLDGDSLENFSDNDGRSQSILFSIEGDNRGAEITQDGLFTWVPHSTQEGVNEFVVSITKMFSSSSNPDAEELSRGRTTFHTFKVLVNPAHNLSGLSENPLFFLTQPVLKVKQGEDYTYTPAVNLPEDSTLEIEILEGPEGLIVGEDGFTLNWSGVDEAYGRFIEIGIFNEDYTEVLVSQRWFLDVISANSILSEEALIQGFTVSQDDTGTYNLNFNWTAPQGDYILEAQIGLGGAWAALNDTVYSGGINKVDGISFEKLPAGNLLFRFNNTTVGNGN